MQTCPIANITVTDRYRKDLGDLDSLAQSLQTVGLLHPIVITPLGILIAGQRRLEAARQLGWAEVPVHVVDLEAIAAGEYAENVHRKDFTPTEIVAIGEVLERLEQARAAVRQRTGKSADGRAGGRGRKNLGATNAKVSVRATRSAYRVAKAVGVGETTYRKAKAVVQAAHANPTQYRDLSDQMDASGNVDRAYQRLKKRQADVSSELPNTGESPSPVTEPPWLTSVRHLHAELQQAEDDAGGRRELVDRWNRVQQQRYAAELYKLGEMVNAWLRVLSGSDNSPLATSVAVEQRSENG